MDLEGNPSAVSQATLKIKLQKTVTHNLNVQTSNGISRIMKNCSDHLEEPEMERKDNTEETFARTSKQVTPTHKLIAELYTNPQNKQCTSGGYVENGAEVLSESQEEDQESQEHIKDKELPENDIQVTSKLKELQVKENQLDSAERPFKCPHCHWAFKKLCYLQSHITTHSGLKPHVCDICGKTFNRPLSLKRHERKHLGERPYSCSDCGKNFALASRMAEHQKTHKGVRPFVCSVCAKSFTKSSNLQHQQLNCAGCGSATPVRLPSPRRTRTSPASSSWAGDTSRRKETRALFASRSLERSASTAAAS
uniref:C2H2-type domain-containing protein n=1 Tax=Neogobius melanostomus TaxID=47308 RepID=A0A8C6SBR0_9GOBI